MLIAFIIYLFIVRPIYAIQAVRDKHIAMGRSLYPDNEVLQSVYNIMGCLTDFDVPNDTAIHVSNDNYTVEIYFPSRFYKMECLRKTFSYCHHVFQVRVSFMSTFSDVDEFSGREVGSLESIINGDVLLPNIKLAVMIHPGFVPHRGTNYISLIIRKYLYRFFNFLWSGVYHLLQ